MRTSEVARQARVNPQTLRYYERRGLLAEPARTGAGYRSYPPETVQVIRFVKRAQNLGFALDDIQGLLNLAGGGPERCDAARGLATAKTADLQARIDDLHAMQQALTRLVQTCEQPRAERDCPLLTEMSSDPESR